MERPAADWKMVVLRLTLMASLLVVGTVLVRNCTDVLEGMVHGAPPAEGPGQPAK